MNKVIVKKLTQKENVVSVGIGKKIKGGVDTGRRAIVVGVKKKVPKEVLKRKDVIPTRVKGQETDVVEVGEISLLEADDRSRCWRYVRLPATDRWRPAPGGISVGHYKVTAGTLGCWVKKNGKYMMLSNNHVLANQNNCEIGDAILQPGKYDGGDLEDDIIAELSYYVRLNMNPELSECPWAKAIASLLNSIATLLGRKTRLIAIARGITNIVDCALGKPLSDGDVVDRILGINNVGGDTSEPEVGMKVKKSGRTTGLTEATITQVEVSLNVNMGEGRMALFEDQFIAEGPDCSQPGDSGSLVVSENGERVGLLFAGGTNLLVANRYSNVKEALELS